MRVAFTPLAGARVDGGACCYLLELGEFCLLLDCGWDDSFDPALLSALAEVAPRVDAVLLSHGDLAHLGALPYARAKLGLKAPIFATLPVRKMGFMHMYDAYATASAHLAPSACAFDDAEGGFSLDAVDDAFDAIKELKFSQIIKLAGGGSSSSSSAPAAADAATSASGSSSSAAAPSGAAAAITIAPHPAGHTIGGSFWRVTVGAEDIIYCPEYNHQRERHLPAGMLHLCSKPTLLVAPARAALSTADRSTARALASYAASALSRGGDVLVPSDAAGRCLELVQVFESHWREHRELQACPIVLLHTQANNTLAFARSQIEWMGEEVIKAFDSRVRSENLFELRHVHACHTLKEAAALPSPKVIIATSADLTAGFAADLLPSILAQPAGLLLLTRRSPAHTPAGVLGQTPTPRHVSVDVHERVPLQGDELEEHVAARAARAAAAAAAKAEAEARALAEVTAEREAAEAAEREAEAAALEAKEKAAAAGSPALAKAAAAGSPALSVVGRVASGLTPRSDSLLPPSTPRFGAMAPPAKHILLPYSEKFEPRDDWGIALSEEEIKHIIDGSAALTAVEAVTGGPDGAPAAGASALARGRVGVDGGAGGGGGGGLGDLDDDDDDAYDDVMGIGDAELTLSLEDEDEDEANGLPPSKWVGRTVELPVRCAVRAVNMEGLSDGRSIKAILSQLMPHTVAIVRGDDASTEHLAEHCRGAIGSAASTHRVFAPTIGETVDGSSHKSAYTIKLSDSLLQGLTPSHIGAYEIARVAGVLDVPNAAAAAAATAMAATATAAAASSAGASGASTIAVAASGAMVDPSTQAASAIVPLRAGLSGVLEPHAAGSEPPGGGSVHFVSQGEVRLAELKQLLSRAGEQTEFVDGALVVNSTVRVRKDGAQRLLIEGAYGEDYLRVRELLYGQVEAI